ncbi:MAG: hypothetical protein K2M76_06135, partial [Muribaculaceae bacterium]|nr:hypothetical protein [Muribaculaceae bacterium]
MTAKRRLLIVLAALIGTSAAINAQSYYDDDIYFDAAKAPKTAVKKKKTPVQAEASTINYTALPGSDTYIVVSNNNRDVDEYNRRGSYTALPDTLTGGIDSLQNFKYTQRLERFHNPDVVIGSGNEDLIYVYNNALQEQNSNASTQINIYMDSPGYWSPYYYPSAWSWAWHTPGDYGPWRWH